MRILGICLFLIDISLTGYSLFEWNLERSSSENFSQKEINYYELKEKEDINRKSTEAQQEDSASDVNLDEVSRENEGL